MRFSVWLRSFKFGDGVVGVKEAELALSLGLSSKVRKSELAYV